MGAQHVRDAIPDDPVRTDIRPSERLPRHGFDGEAPQLGHVHRILRLPSVASRPTAAAGDRKSTRLNSSHLVISYAVFCLKKKKQHKTRIAPHLRRYLRRGLQAGL